VNRAGAGSSPGERFKARDHQATAVLARPVDRYLIGIERDHIVVGHGDGEPLLTDLAVDPEMCRVLIAQASGLVQR
jgi:hypothetical protein